MDFLKGIGDFFNGWLGGKKRKRIQDEMNAVGEQAYQQVKEEASARPQSQPQAIQPTSVSPQIQADRQSQPQPKLANLSEDSQQATQSANASLNRFNANRQARFNQMRRMGAGFGEATGRLQAEQDAINQQVRAREAEEREKHEREVKQPLREQIEQSRQAINNSTNISQYQKDATNKRADELLKKINHVANLGNVEYKDWWTPDYERFSKLNQRINEAHSLGKSVFDQTGDAEKARQAINQQLEASETMTRLEDQEKSYRDTAKAIALPTQLPRDIIKNVGRYGAKLATGGIEALGNMTNNQAVANAARQGQRAIDEAVFNKFDTEYDNQILKGLTSGVTDLGMDIATGKAVVGALGKAGVLGKITQGADKANKFLSQQGKLSGLVGKGIQAGLGSSEAIASTATSLLRHYPQNYNEIYSDARAKGMDHNQANVLAHSNAVINAGIEKMNLDMSGWFKAPATTPNRGFQAIKRALGEGAEEWTQAMATYAVKSIYSDINWNKALTEANESGLMGVAVGGIADQISTQLPKVLHKLDQEIDHKVNPATQPITNALIKTEIKQQISQAVQPDSQVLAEAMKLNDEAVKYKLASDEQVTQSDSQSTDFDYDNRQFQQENFENISSLKQLHQQYGDNFYERLPDQLQATYDQLLDDAPRDSQGRYQDPITGETWIDERVYSPELGKDIIRINEAPEYLQNVNNKQRVRAIKDYMMQNFSGKKASTIDGLEVNFSDDSAGKYASSVDPITAVGKREPNSSKRLRAWLVPDLINAVEIAEPFTDGRLNHYGDQKPSQRSHGDKSKGGWDYRKFNIEFEGQLYEGKLNVRNDGTIGEFYDIYPIKKTDSPRTSGDSQLENSGSSRFVYPTEVSSEPNIAQSDQNVNDDAKYKLDDLDPVYKKLLANPSLKQHLHDSVRARWDEDQNSKVGDTTIDSDRLISSYASRLTPEEYSRFDWDRAEDLIFDELSRLEKEHSFKPDERYQLNQTQSANEFIEQNLRHILGDEYKLVTDRNQLDSKALNAQGYADLKNHIVAILDGKMDTGYHEAGHIVFHALSRVDAQMADKAINSIISHYGAENLVKTANQAGYDQVIGHKLDFNNEADVNLAAEEQLMNDFARYAEAKAKGRENYYAKTNNLSARVKQWFDNVIAYLKDMVGRLDVAHDFMHRAERGDFAQLVDSQVRAERGELFGNSEQLSAQMAYKIDPETNIVHINNDILKGVHPKGRVKVISQYFKDNYQGHDYDLNYGQDGTARISAKSRNKYLDPNQAISELILKGKMAGELPDILRVSQKIGEATDTKSHDFANKGFEYRQSTVKIGNEFYNVRLNVGINDKGKLFYTINGIKKAPEFHKGNLSGGDNSNLPQSDENVKFKLSESAQEVSDFYYNDHQSPAEMRQELINKLWEANKKGQGVDHIFHEAKNALDDTYMVRASNNSPFYSAYFEANSKKPTKAGITAIVDEILGVENDKQRPTVTSEMWQALAGEYGDLGGISSAYKRLLNKQEMRPQTTKETIRKAIQRKQSEQNFVDLANGVNSDDAVRSHNESVKQQSEAKFLGDDEATKRKIMTHNLRPEHKALKTAPYQVLEIYEALQKDLKRAGQNIAISDQNLNKEDVGKFKQQYKHILNEMNRLVDGEVSRQRLLKSTQQIQNKLAEWRDNYQKNNDTVFPTLDGAISTNFLNQTAPSFDKVRDQISDWTGLDKKQSTHYLNNMLERTGYEVADGTITSVKGAGLQMSDDELDLLKRTNKSKRLNDKKRREIYSDRLIQALADKASDDGQTYQIIYTTNKDTNATGILNQLGEDGDYEPTTYSPEDHYIYKGAVYQRNSNKFLGHLIQITPSAEKDGGISQIKVWDGNTYVSSNIDFSKLKGGYDRRYNTALNLENVADGDEKLLAALNATLVDPVRQGEAKLKEEAIKVADNLTQYEKAIKKLVGRRRAKEAMFDLVLFIEPPQTNDDGKKIDRAQYLSNAEATLQNKYGQKTFEKMVEAKKYIRELYDDLLERENTQRLKYGMPLIKKRQDYLSHYVELSANADPIHDNLGGNLMRDIFGKQQRGSIPTVMQGLTHDTKVKKKFAGYEKHRLTDNNKPLNAFDAVRTYARTSLYNIHMMDAIAGIRGFETAIKAYESINSLKPNHQAKLLFGDTPSNYDNTQLSSFVKFVQEHANIVAGKSSSADREALASDDGAEALKRWRRLQQITGLSKIAGNVGSFAMQGVNQAVVAAELIGDKKGIRSYLSSWISLLADNSASATARKKLFNSDVEAVWKKSNFLRARYADASGLDVINSKAERAIKGIGKATEFLGVLEQISTTQGWTAYYKQARAQGKTEAQAILIADHKANKTLTGRGIGDGAHIYSDTKEAAIRQFTREANDVWRLMTNNKKNGGWNARQMMVFLAATYGLNALMKAMRGSKATPDPLEAIINELKEIKDGKDKVTAGIDMIRGVTGEVANMHPSAQILLAMMPDNARKMVFGEDSEIGRYGMKPAITSVIGDTFTTADHIIGGRLNKAGQSAVSMMPFGAQIKKTWEGVEALNQGYTTNQYGRPKQAVERDLGNVIRGTLFGKTGLSGDDNASQVRNLQKEYDLKKQLKDHGVNINNIDEWKPTGDNDKDEKARSAIFKYKMGDDLKIYQLSETKRKQAIVDGQLTKKRLETIDQKARQIKQKLGMEVEELDKYQDTFDKVNLERDYLDKTGYDNDEDKQSIGRKVALAELKLKLSKNPADRPILEAYDRMEAAGFKRFNKNDLRRFTQHQDNPQEFWNKLLDLDKQQYQITGKYKLHNQDGKPDTIEQTARGRGRRKSGKINFNSGVDFSAINAKARSVGQSINSPTRGAVSYQISNNAFTYQPMPIRRSSLKLPKYSKKR